MHRTRKLETPLHFDGGLFSDIRSTDGKLLSKVTVDRVLRSTHHDVTDSPSIDVHHDEKNYVDDIIKTEKITNEDVITVKFTPVQRELESPYLFTSLQTNPARDRTPVEYLKDDFKDLESYKIVNSLCKTNLFETQKTGNDKLSFIDTNKSMKESSEPLNISTFMHKNYSSLTEYPVPKNLEPETDRDELDLPQTKALREYYANEESTSIAIIKEHSPLANFLLSEQLSRIDTKLQESLQICSGNKDNIPFISLNEETNMTSAGCGLELFAEQKSNNNDENIKKPRKSVSDHSEVMEEIHETNDKFETQKNAIDVNKLKAKGNSDHNNFFRFKRVIYNLPIHYHAAILCFFLIVYNLIYQYVKQKYEINKKLT